MDNKEMVTNPAMIPEEAVITVSVNDLQQFIAFIL